MKRRYIVIWLASLLLACLIGSGTNKHPTITPTPIVQTVVNTVVNTVVVKQTVERLVVITSIPPLPRTSTSTPTQIVTPTNTTKITPKPTNKPVVVSTSVNTGIRCVDGSISYAKHTQGACSKHGGIAT